MKTRNIAIGVLAVVAAGVVAFAIWFNSNLDVPPLEVGADASQTSRLEAVDAWLTGLHEAHKFNGGVLLAREGRPLLMKAYGVADHEGRVPLSTRSLFRLASVSKQFTAAGVLSLVESGSLELDQSVSTYLPGFPYPGVTVAHLLNMTSGIPDVYFELADEERQRLGNTLSVAEVAQLFIAKAPPAVSAPGAQFAYSNSSYVLLAAIVERVSGSGFEAFMRNAVFGRLGMRHCRVWNLESRDEGFAGQVASFMQLGASRSLLSPTWVDGVAGDGAVFCSLEDLLIWDRAWAEQRFLRSELLARALAPATLADGSTSDYGFGWFLADDHVWHGGGWLGARTYLARYPDEELLLVVLDNSKNPRIDAIVQELTRALTAG